jgi:hypothetical protein
MKQVTFSIKVPDWFPAKNELEQFRRWVRYKLNPPRCSTCNTKIITEHGYFDGKINGQDFCVNLRPARCKKCAEEYINSLDLKKVKCSSCGETKKGTGYHNKNGNVITMMWGGSWNGKNHCIDCITHTIKTGKIETDIKRWNKSKQRTESVYY